MLDQSINRETNQVIVESSTLVGRRHVQTAVISRVPGDLQFETEK